MAGRILGIRSTKKLDCVSINAMQCVCVCVCVWTKNESNSSSTYLLLADVKIRHYSRQGRVLQNTSGRYRRVSDNANRLVQYYVFFYL